MKSLAGLNTPCAGPGAGNTRADGADSQQPNSQQPNLFMGRLGSCHEGMIASPSI